MQGNLLVKFHREKYNLCKSHKTDKTSTNTGLKYS